MNSKNLSLNSTSVKLFRQNSLYRRAMHMLKTRKAHNNTSLSLYATNEVINVLFHGFSSLYFGCLKLVTVLLLQSVHFKNSFLKLSLFLVQ